MAVIKDSEIHSRHRTLYFVLGSWTKYKVLRSKNSDQFLHGWITPAVVVAPSFEAMNLSTSSSTNSPLTTKAFSVSTSPVLFTLSGSRKIFHGEPQLRVSPVSWR